MVIFLVILGAIARPESGRKPKNIRKDWRRRPDLNRGWRFCRPLPYHLATAPIGPDGGNGQASRPARHARAEKIWSGKRDSNPRLRPWQGRTLPLSYSRSTA